MTPNVTRSATSTSPPSWGDFETAHTEGNNEHVVATDTQKNTVFAKAKELG